MLYIETSIRVNRESFYTEFNSIYAAHQKRSNILYTKSHEGVAIFLSNSVLVILLLHLFCLVCNYYQKIGNYCIFIVFQSKYSGYKIIPIIDSPYIYGIYVLIGSKRSKSDIIW